MPSDAAAPDLRPTVSVYMMADGAQRVIDFAKATFDAEAILFMKRENGSVMHASLRIGDSVVMLSDGTDEFPPFPVWLHVYVRDADETYRRALRNGATSIEPPSEKGDGDRRGGVRDVAGNSWWIASPALSSSV